MQVIIDNKMKQYKTTKSLQEKKFKKVENCIDLIYPEGYNEAVQYCPLQRFIWLIFERVSLMYDIEYYKRIFDRYGGMMRTTQLAEEKVFYQQREKLIEDGYVEKVRRGYYQWVNPDDFSEAGTVISLFPDAILCMDTALRYYGYSDRTPADWHLAVSKDSGKSRFNIDYPFVKPYYYEPHVHELGLSVTEIDGHQVRIYDKDRLICDCLRYRNKMDKEIFNRAIQSYIADTGKNIPNLLAYASALRVKTLVKGLIGVWL